MTSCILSLALVFTPTPLQAPKESTWQTESVSNSWASASTAEGSSTRESWSFPPMTTLPTLDLSQVSAAIPVPSTILPPPPLLTARELVDQIFGWPGAQLVECESHWNQYAVGRFGERGLFQIHPLWIPEIVRLGWTWDAMFEIEPNVQMAAHIRRVQGLRAWTCWRG